MSYDNRQRRGYGSENLPVLDTSKIELANVDAELFNAVAQETAQTLAASGEKTNQPTQLRRFYDEIVMWDNRASMHPKKFEEYLPFIRMLNAKAAYAHGRNNEKKLNPGKGLVDQNYVALLSHCLKQVDDDKTMRNFKLFMEAMMGFYKQERPSG